MIQSSLVWHLLLLSLVIVGHIYSIEECPSEAVLVDNRCFYLVMADDPQGFASVFEARNSCRAETPSGDIASLESREKHRAAFSLVEKIPKNRRPGRVFIGLHDIANESVYEWFNGGDGHEYSLWAPGEPNNLHENNEDCVTVESDNLQWQLDGATGWKDYPCCVRTLINAVFCQIEINSTKQPYDIQQDPLATACFGDWDECESSPCHNQGVCVDKLLSFICVCQPGFTGPLCQSVVTCPPVPVWRVVVPNKVIDREYSTEVNYTCAEGLELSQGVFAISSCSTNATWEPPFQDCLSPNRRAKVRIKKPTTEAQGAVAIGTVGLIFVICELTLMVMMDLNLFCLHIVILKNNVQSFFKYMWLKVQSPMTPVPTESYL